jgi:hypothetical protein
MSKPKHPATEDRPPEARHDDEPVHVPKGQSRMRFFMILGLMVFTLVIYVVPRQMQSLLERGSKGDAAFVSWRAPDHSEVSFTVQQFQLRRQTLASFLYAIGQPDRGSNKLTSDENLARLLIVDGLARDAGVDVSDAAVAKSILEGQFLMVGEQFVYMRGFQESKNFQEVCTGNRIAPHEFQETLRMLMRVDRYEMLLSFALAQPDPATYEADWKSLHQEHSFDFVTSDVSQVQSDAHAALPADPELKIWYDALPNKNRVFAAEWKPERVSAELVGWSFDAAAEPAGLLAKYPRPEGADLEQLAKDYYNLFANVRFRRAAEKADATDDHDRLFSSFDEVADAARRESKVHAAFVDWQKTLKDRAAAGETLDLATEAAALGLTYRKEETPKSSSEWNALAELGGPLMTQKLIMAARGDKTIDVFVGANAIQTGRVLERVAAGAPPFEEVHDKAVVEWEKQKAIDLAQEKLTGLRALLQAKGPTTEAQPEPAEGEKLIADAATFEAKASDRGLKVLHTDWFDPTKIPEALPENATDVDRFLADVRAETLGAAQKRGASAYITAAEGEIIGPRQDPDRQHVWLARAVGKRDPPVVAIQPKDLDQLKGNATNEAQRKYREEVIGAKAFARTFELKFSDGRVIGTKTDDDTQG